LKEEIIVIAHHRLVRIAVAVALGLVAPALADNPKKPDPKDDKQVVDTKAEKRATATGVDFKKELNLPFQSLGTLGARIESARRQHDPVGLAHTANELAVAEKVSGKKATVTSSALMKEAAELAQLRREAAELKATLEVAQQVSSEETLVKNLKESIATADKLTKDETRQVQMNEEPTGPRKLLINNYTPQYVDIWINGFYKMQVPPGQSKWCVIEHKWNPTVLKAYGNDDSTTWGPRYIWGTFKTYTWNLN
jgi:hypothetical protein